MTFSFTRSGFPDDFTFGTATAAFQIEGGQGPETGRGPSIWDDFCATPGNVKGGHDGTVACDHYNRWESDLDLLKEGGFGAYRFSFAWPRIQPAGSGALNETGLDFYDRLIDGMLERGLKPFGTLYHWDLPSPLQDRGGWRSREVCERFADYAAIVAKRYGDRLHAIATLNEPWCTSFLSHFLGIHAPGVKDVRATAHSMHHTLLAHGMGVQAMRAEGASNLGIVTNHDVNRAPSGKPEDEAAARRWDGIINRWFLEGLHRGQYPSDVVEEGFAGHMPEGYEDDMATVSTPIDWHGVNYYTRVNLKAVPGARWPAMMPDEPEVERTGLGWEVYPEGLMEVLERVHAHAGGIPIFVTENGAAYDDPEPQDGRVKDDHRVSYYERHLRACLAAIERGVPLKGYFAWSLMDNFEWAEGYGERFGIVRVNYDTQERTPKDSFRAFQALLGQT